MEGNPKSLGALISWVREKNFSLSLTSEKIAYIFAIFEFSESEGRELYESDLSNAYRMVVEEFGLDVENFSLRFSNVLSSLVEQKIISLYRSGTFGEACYRLTHLAMHIKQSYERDKQFSKVKISLILSNLSVKLQLLNSKIVSGLSSADLLNELSFIVQEDIERVDIIQRNMDEEQSLAKDQLSLLLKRDWSDALVDCDDILTQTASRIKEISEVISTLSGKLLADFEEMLSLLDAHDVDYAVYTTIERLRLMVERVKSWGEFSLNGWVSYEHNLQVHIRKIVSVDRSKRISERLLKLMLEKEHFGLTVACPDSVVGLRETTLRNTDMPVTGELIVHEIASHEDFMSLDDRLREWFVANVVQGADIDIVLLIASAIKYFKDEEKVDVATRVALLAQELKRPSSSAEPQWVAIQGGIEVRAKILDRKVN